MASDRPLYLCAGLQSSGSTVVSWCFLQRADMDGVLDARNDILPDIAGVSAPLAWCKITISSFRLSEMIGHYEDEGWQVRPSLVVRDVRAVFNSLLGKHYGSNGITAEEPPLRMRMRRFKEDWQLTRDRGWPVIRYETLCAEPETTLQRACTDYVLPWDEAMVTWPKRRDDMADPAHGSPTFRKSLGANLRETLKPSLADVKVRNIPPGDLEWLEREFADFNRATGYAEHIAPAGQASENGTPQRDIPRWENTRRYLKTQKPLARLSAGLSELKARLTGSRGKSTARGE